MPYNAAEAREYREFVELCRRIRSTTSQLVPKEAPEVRRARIERLKRNFEDFCKYYFPNLTTAEFGWFHKRAARRIIRDPNIFAVLEWPREHAKSVFADIMVPMFLYARGELTGMIIASSTGDKAATLLSDLRAQFEANELWRNDYGNLCAPGEWRSDYFATVNDCGFWAFGRGQSPRGVRKAASRPNYCVVDDIDDKTLCRNSRRVRDTVDWILEDVYGALSIQGARMIVCGNRIHKSSTLAHIVGDIEPGDPKRDGIYHLKVWALEDPRTHRKNMGPDGVPAWRERYTREMIEERMRKIGHRAALREFFHEHIEEGIVFRHEWIQWGPVPRKDRLDTIVVYGDPSFKNTKASDYKAVVAVGRKGPKLFVLDAWVAQATIRSMVQVFYDLFDRYGEFARYYIEANMLQDLLFKDEFIAEGERRGYQLPLRHDKRRKPDKVTRIENLTPLFERGLISFNERMKKDPGMQMLVAQLLGFPDSHDDGPDALEGAIHMLRQAGRGAMAPRLGRYRRNSRRM